MTQQLLVSIFISLYVIWILLLNDFVDKAGLYYSKRKLYNLM